jgi:alanine-glyoxylate transaminase/serine-glyoxylate transaminase/serine-pyruvate transaminase
MPSGHDADEFRQIVLDRFNMSLGSGLGKLKGSVFRIGHLGSFNDLMLTGTLSGVEMGLALAAVPHRRGGVQAAIDSLCKMNETSQVKAAQVKSFPVEIVN